MITIDPNLKKEYLTAFICNESYHLTEIAIYENGYIDCWELVTLEGFIEKVQQGWVTVELDSEQEDISIFGVGEIAPGFQYRAYKTNSDLIAEVKDIICKLNQRPDSSARCLDAWSQYQQQPNEENCLRLKNAYEEIPRHNRCYILGDQDLQDTPIRRVIYPDQPYTWREALFDPAISQQLHHFAEAKLQTISNQPKEQKIMKNFEENLAKVSIIKKQYESEIQNFINQKLVELQEKINLPIQYIDIDLEQFEEDGRYQTQVEQLKLNITIEL